MKDISVITFHDSLRKEMR